MYEVVICWATFSLLVVVSAVLWYACHFHDQQLSRSLCDLKRACPSGSVEDRLLEPTHEYSSFHMLELITQCAGEPPNSEDDKLLRQLPTS